MRSGTIAEKGRAFNVDTPGGRRSISASSVVNASPNPLHMDWDINLENPQQINQRCLQGSRFQPTYDLIGSVIIPSASERNPDFIPLFLRHLRSGEYVCNGSIRFLSGLHRPNKSYKTINRTFASLIMKLLRVR